MAEPIVIAISFPSATEAKPKKNLALVLLVKTKRLSVPESVAQKSKAAKIYESGDEAGRQS